MASARTAASEGSICDLQTVEHAALGTLRILRPDHPDRAGLQRFIAESFARVYGARIAHFAEQLVGLPEATGGWAAAAGYTLAAQRRLFVEQYLDRPVEQAIAAALGEGIARSQIVEVGNFAAHTPGAARQVISCMTALLHHLGRTWVVFTSTRSLLNSFARLGIAPIVLAPADPTRLPDRGVSWGSYYATGPQVMTANIPLGFIHLGLTVARCGA
jgi:hypothetical protein